VIKISGLAVMAYSGSSGD